MGRLLLPISPPVPVFVTIILCCSGCTTWKRPTCGLLINIKLYSWLISKWSISLGHRWQLLTLSLLLLRGGVSFRLDAPQPKSTSVGMWVSEQQLTIDLEAGRCISTLGGQWATPAHGKSRYIQYICVPQHRPANNLGTEAHTSFPEACKNLLIHL